MRDQHLAHRFVAQAVTLESSPSRQIGSLMVNLKKLGKNENHQIVSGEFNICTTNDEELSD